MSGAITVISGNVVNDPTFRMVGDSAKLEFTVASDHRWQDASGEWQSRTAFVDVVAWRGLADDLANVLEKGVGVLVSGRLEQRSWEDKDTGAKRSKIEVIANDGAILARSIESFVRKRKGDGSAPQRKASSSGARQQTMDGEPF